MKTSELPPLKPLDKGTLRARHAAGFLNIQDAIEQAYKDAKVAPPEPPKVELRWENRAGQLVTWKTPALGSITVEIQKHFFGTVQEEGTLLWARIGMKDNTSNWLNFRVRHKLAPGVRLLYYQFKQAKDVTEGEVPIFTVRVDWQNGVPYTKNTDAYDISLVLVGSDGNFIQLELGVTTRAGHFWLSFQETWAAQIARTTQAKAAELDVTTAEIGGFSLLAAPLYSENAYPGADFLGTDGMIHEVLSYGVERDIVKPLSKCSRAPWVPVESVLPEEMKNDGWTKATVLWFNLVYGMGFAVCEDGTNCHLHFSKIVDPAGVPLAKRDLFPVLHPMRQIAIKWVKNDRGRSATAIRTL